MECWNRAVYEFREGTGPRPLGLSSTSTNAGSRTGRGHDRNWGAPSTRSPSTR